MSVDEWLGDLAPPQLQSALAGLAQPLLAYFGRRTSNAMDAQDCLSEVYLTLWRRRAEIPSSIDELRPYAYGVARLVLKNSQRSEHGRQALDQELRADLIVRAIPHVDRKALEGRELLESVGEQDRELLTLVYWDGLSIRDAGASLGLRGPAAHKRHSRAINRLRAILRSAGDVGLD